MDILISTTMKSDPNKSMVMASQKDVTGEGEIWRYAYHTNGFYYEIQKVENFVSTITNNSGGNDEKLFWVI